MALACYLAEDDIDTDDLIVQDLNALRSGLNAFGIWFCMQIEGLRRLTQLMQQELPLSLHFLRWREGPSTPRGYCGIAHDRFSVERLISVGRRAKVGVYFSGATEA